MNSEELNCLILYSKSPRRKAMLSDLHLFDVVVGDSSFVEKKLPDETAKDYVLRNALGKLSKGIKIRPGPKYGNFAELAADTVVVHNDEVLEKPINHCDAGRMLTALQGSTHQVLTGVALRFTGSDGSVRAEECFFVSTEVELTTIGDKAIGIYLDSGDWADKAGGYGIQGFIGSFVSHIHGSYSNVVGLPTAQVLPCLSKNNFI